MRGIIVSTLAVLALGGATAPAIAQTCSELEQQVQQLTARVEQLERRLAAPAAATPAAAPARSATAAPAAAPTRPAAAATDDGREAALALYARIDGLVAGGKVEQAREELTAWDLQHAGTPQASWTRALGRELAVVGKPAPPDWSIDHWFQGESEVALDGQRPTLVVFWEAWCPHCRAEVPKLEKLAEQYGPRGLQVVGVTRITKSATEDSVKSFLAESGVAYPIAKETGQLADYFDVKGIPAAALVKDGKIVWRGHPIRLTDELMTAWLR